MFSRVFTAITAAAFLLAGSVNGAALIATDPGISSALIVILIYADAIYISVSACGAPNNTDHNAGSSCKYYAGPSDTSTVISGSA